MFIVHQHALLSLQGMLIKTFQNKNLKDISTK